MNQGNTGLFGTVGTIATFSLAQVNAVIGCIAGLLTIAYVGLGVRHRWVNRNNKRNNYE